MQRSIFDWVRKLDKHQFWLKVPIEDLIKATYYPANIVALLPNIQTELNSR